MVSEGEEESEMLPVEETLLSELRRKENWSVLKGKRLDGLLKTDEARLLYRVLEKLRENGSGEVIPKNAITRLASVNVNGDSTLVQRAIAKLGDPSSPELSRETVWTILATHRVLGVQARLQDHARTGALYEHGPGLVRTVLEDLEELRGLSRRGGGFPGEIEDLSPRQLASVKGSKATEGGERLPTFLHSMLDLKLGGGLRRKELGLLVAPTNHGKTANLIRIACGLSEKGLKVLYMSFEIYLDQIAERVRTLLGRKPKPTLLAQEYDSDTLTVEEVTRIADQVSGLDCLIVDHLDLLRFDGLDLINAHGMAIRKLRNFARRSNGVVWTAAQADEPVFGQTRLHRSQLYGSRQKLHACDLGIGFIYLPQRETLTMDLWKTRHTKAGLQFISQADMVRLKFKELV